uniref:ATP-grasp enzyme n=3 Tax=unclassified bacterial viruses TaxID=12333 RepID=A0AAU6W011_9VIRU
MTTQKLRILTNAASNGAGELKAALTALGVNVTTVRNDRPQGRLSNARRTLKWGSFTRTLEVANEDSIINNHAGQSSLNKKRCFELLRERGVPIPEFTTERAVAEDWIRAGGFRVYERHSLTGSAGEGIVVANNLGDLSATVPPLYTQGIKGKRREYRIHVFNMDGVQRYFVQQKKRRAGFQEQENYTSEVRNLESGWIFANQDITQPRQVTLDAAVAACKALKLNFGAVDLIEQEKANGGSFVLEVNTAPGLQGATVNFYASSLVDALNGVVDATDDTDEQPEVTQ